MDIRQVLRQLSETAGPTGREEGIASTVAALMRPLCDEVMVDPLFNVIALKRGQGDTPRPRLMLMAHLDEIFMMVTAVEGPFLRLMQAKTDPRFMVGQEVIVLGKRPLRGIIGDRPPHFMGPEERKTMPRLADLVVDLGMDAAAVADLVQVGDVILMDRPLIELQGDRVAGKALDNRLGVATLLAALDQLQDQPHPCDLLVVANVGEELNGLGAQTTAFQLRPDLAIVIDTTFGEQPGTSKNETFALGEGPVLGIGPNLHPRLNDVLIELAGRLELPYRLEALPVHSGTDAWQVQVAAGGIPTALLSIPIRNMHSPVEVADLRDVGETARWLVALAGACDPGLLARMAYRLPDFTKEAA